MCVVSNIGDSWKEQFPERYTWYPNHIPVPMPGTRPNEVFPQININIPTREEFEKLKADVEALRELLKAAKIYDEKTNQRDCEMDDKIEFIKKIADAVGVNLEDVFAKT